MAVTVHPRISFQKRTTATKCHSEKTFLVCKVEKLQLQVTVNIVEVLSSLLVDFSRFLAKSAENS